MCEAETRSANLFEPLAKRCHRTRKGRDIRSQSLCESRSQQKMMDLAQCRGSRSRSAGESTDPIADRQHQHAQSSNYAVTEPSFIRARH